MLYVCENVKALLTFLTRALLNTDHRGTQKTTLSSSLIHFVLFIYYQFFLSSRGKNICLKVLLCESKYISMCIDSHICFHPEWYTVHSSYTLYDHVHFLRTEPMTMMVLLASAILHHLSYRTVMIWNIKNNKMIICILFYGTRKKKYLSANGCFQPFYISS